MKFREHRYLLAESMETMIEVKDRDELILHLKAQLDRWDFHFNSDEVKIEPYSGMDKRIGWDTTYIVSLPGYGVLGFTNGPL
jgi:hypothetical protein